MVVFQPLGYYDGMGCVRGATFETAPHCRLIYNGNRFSEGTAKCLPPFAGLSKAVVGNDATDCSVCFVSG